jgi:hypothetical protein
LQRPLRVRAASLVTVSGQCRQRASGIAGLSDDELRRQSMPPSTLSLLGLVRHMAEVERTWFRRVINGEDIPLVWSADCDFQVAYAASLDVTGHQPSWGEGVSLRLVMLHLLHEYARHNGHADFLREGIDGTVGA